MADIALDRKALGPPPSDTHCPAPNYECIDELGQVWHDNFDAVLTEIQTLRDGQPTAIRLVNAANLWVIVPEVNADFPESFATTGGARIFELLTVARVLGDAGRQVAGGDAAGGGLRLPERPGQAPATGWDSSGALAIAGPSRVRQWPDQSNSRRPESSCRRR